MRSLPPLPALPLVALSLICPLLLRSAPPAGSGIALLILAAGLFVAALRWRSLWTASVLLAGAGLAINSLEHALSLRIEERFDVQEVVGIIDGLPFWRGDTLRFSMLAEAGPWGSEPRRLAVRWYAAETVPLTGKHWRFDLAVSPVRGRLNFQGHDSERTALALGIDGEGQVRGAAARAASRAHARHEPLESLAPLRWANLARWKVREGLDDELAGLPGAGLVRALAIGDRSGLSDKLLENLHITGTGHLLAISGMHVGLVALFAIGLARVGLGAVAWRGQTWPARRLAPFLGLALATAYAGLAGFGTSPRRALVMLSVCLLALMLRRQLTPWQGWWLALVLVLLLDPLAPLLPGFWLSFGAVAVLFLAFVGRQPLAPGLAGLLRAQTAMLPGMFALGVAWFGAVSLGSWFANLLAIPWVSGVTLPLVLITLVALPFQGAVPSVLAHMAERSASHLAGALDWTIPLLDPLAWTAPQPGLAMVGLAGLGGLLCLAPRGIGVRRFGLLLMLPLVIPPPGQPPGTVNILALDVGQGQATWVTTEKHSLLVDPGPGMPGQWSLVGSTVVPAFRQFGRARPDLVLVSHGDLDHAGGLSDVRSTWPAAPVTGNWRSAPAEATACNDGRRWNWDQVGFRVLHPSPWLPYQGNDSSCVLQLLAPGGRILLPGDIGKHVEHRLAGGRFPGAHRLLLAPHHGSRSSSSTSFLDWADPETVILSVGDGNRFGLPDQEVLSRYARRGVAAWSTADCGAIRVTLWPDGRLDAQSARRSRRGPWRFPAGHSCP